MTCLSAKRPSNEKIQLQFLYVHTYLFVVSSKDTPIQLIYKVGSKGMTQPLNHRLYVYFVVVSLDLVVGRIFHRYVNIDL